MQTTPLRGKPPPQPPPALYSARTNAPVLNPIGKRRTPLKPRTDAACMSQVPCQTIFGGLRAGYRSVSSGIHFVSTVLRGILKDTELLALEFIDRRWSGQEISGHRNLAEAASNVAPAGK